jgi:hypothetical protein
MTVNVKWMNTPTTWMNNDGFATHRTATGMAEINGEDVAVEKTMTNMRTVTRRMDTGQIVSIVRYD